MRKPSWTAWEAVFGRTPPIGYLLRDRASDEWLRLYTLPDGDRLPLTPDGIREVVRRQNLVASTLFGVGASVTAWITDFSGRLPHVSGMGEWRLNAEEPKWDLAGLDSEAVDGAEFFERTLVWRPGALDTEMRLRALDEVGPFTVFSPDRGNAFCPYDGGMDLFVSRRELLASLRALFPDWVSTHPAGL